MFLDEKGNREAATMPDLGGARSEATWRPCRSESLGCYNKYHRLGGLSNRHLFHTVLESGKFKIKVPAKSVPDEAPSSGLQMAAFFLCLHISGLLVS